MIRTAVRLAEVYSTRAAKAVETALRDRLTQYDRQLNLLVEALCKGEPEVCEAAPFGLQRRLRGLVRAVEQAVRPACQNFQEQRAKVPGPKSLLAELRQIDEEFGGLDLNMKQKTLRVETERVVLEGIDLGPFALELAWSRLLREGESNCFHVEALDPRPASANDEVTHPHVRNGVLCPGEAAVPIQRALEIGRLADAFLLVRGVLMNYNPASPYVEIALWTSDESDDVGLCRDCGFHTARDEMSSCERCGEEYCPDCLGPCGGCDTPICSSCEVRCALCEERGCPACLVRCPVSGKRCCDDCLPACAGCGVAIAKDLLDAGSGRCTACVSKWPGERPLIFRAFPLAEIEPVPTMEINDVSTLAPAAG
jgi:hypothetical protein